MEEINYFLALQEGHMTTIIHIYFILFTATEEKACMSKHLHSSAMSENSLATVCASSTTKVLPSFKEQSLSVSDCEIRENDGKFFTSFNKENWTSHSNDSDGVRWNQSPTHTYDSCFMLPDIVTSNVRSEEKLNVLLGDNFILQDKTSLSLIPFSSEIKPLVIENDGSHVSECSSAESVSVVPVTKSSSAKPLESGKRVSKVQKKGKKTVSKKTTATAKMEKVSKAVSEKAAPKSSVKKKLKTKSKQIMAAPEKLDVLEEDVNVQDPMKDSATKVKSPTKGKKVVKKHSKQLKKEEENRQYREVRRRGREASFNQSLAAFASVCVSNLMFYRIAVFSFLFFVLIDIIISYYIYIDLFQINLGMLNRAAHTLLYYRQCARHSVRKDECHIVSSVKPYNIVLQGYAHKVNHLSHEPQLFVSDIVFT